MPHFLLRGVYCGFLIALVVAAQRSNASAPGSSPAFDDIARAELSSDPAFEKQRVFVANGILVVDLSPGLPPDWFRPSDHYELPLEAMIRALALRRDFRRFFPDDQFWVKPVQSIEDAAQQAMDGGGISDEAGRAGFQNKIAALTQELAEVVRIAAREKHLDVRTSRDPAPGYHVQVIIQPSTARVRYMQFLTYQICQKIPDSAQERADCMREHWNDLNEGPLTLIGRYRYLAAWGKDLGGDEEGSFDITHDSIVTLHPPRIGKDDVK